MWEGFRPDKWELIRFSFYNIRNGWNAVLESTLHVMDQENVYLGVFQETVVMDGVPTRELYG